MKPMMTIEALSSGYPDVPVLSGVDLTVDPGEIVSVIGANGAGKTTLLRTIAGALTATTGRVLVDGADITSLPANKVATRGVALVPEGRNLFPYLTVTENLHLGAYHRRARRRRDETLAEAFDLFPRLRERRNQQAGSLSGGEQQMCALARGLMARPTLLLLDEPSLGLAPVVVEQIFELIALLPERGLTVLLVEQNVSEALDLSTRGYVLDQGRIVLSGTADELLTDTAVQDTYLGIG